MVPVLPGHGDGTEERRAQHGVEGERHQGLLVCRGGDESLGAVHVGAEDDDGRVDAGDDHQHGEESPRQLGRGELADLCSDES